jgi:cobalt-precorrin 5A hydrolase
MTVAGLGFRQGVTCAALADAIAKARAMTGDRPISAIATHEAKSVHPSLQALALQLDLPVLAIEAAALSKVETETQSRRVASLYGTGSVAEAAALAAAGDGARLICARVVSEDGMATAAIAEGGSA